MPGQVAAVLGATTRPMPQTNVMTTDIEYFVRMQEQYGVVATPQQAVLLSACVREDRTMHADKFPPPLSWTRRMNERSQWWCRHVYEMSHAHTMYNSKSNSSSDGDDVVYVAASPNLVWLAATGMDVSPPMRGVQAGTASSWQYNAWSRAREF